MHLLLIHQYFLEPDAGGGSRFNEMCRLWTGMGHRVTVLAGMVDYTTGTKAEEYRGRFLVRKQHSESLTVFRCHVSRSYNRSFLGRLWAYFSFVFSSSVCVLTRLRGRHDIVLATSPPLFVAITGILVQFTKRVPLVFEVRDLWPESAVDTGVLTNPLLIRLAYWFERFVYRRASLVNVLTPAFERVLHERKDVPAPKLSMIPNGADFSIADQVMEHFHRNAFRAEHGLWDSFVVIYVGAHGVANHLGQLVDAAEQLTDTHALFLLVGDGMEKPRLQADVESRGLRNVRFVDPVPKAEVFKYILAADAGASVLKKCETFTTIYSNKTFDYMSCGKPIILAIDGVSRELIKAARCGLFVRPEDPTDLAEKVRFYMDNRAVAREHGANGSAYAREHFDRDGLAHKYMARLREVAE